MNTNSRRWVRHALLVGLLLSGAACKSGNVTGPEPEPPPPPPPPHTHDRTGFMTARVDGVPWAASTVADTIIGFVNLVDADSTHHWPAAIMLMGVCMNPSSSLAAYVVLPGAPGPADFSLGVGTNTGGASTYDPGDAINPFIFRSDPAHLGQLRISELDLVNWRAKGTFSFSLVRRDGATMEVTDGQFDLPMDHNGNYPAALAIARSAMQQAVMPGS